MAVPNVKVPISISLPYDLVCEVDEICKKKDLSRSAFILEAIEKSIEEKRAN